MCLRGVSNGLVRLWCYSRLSGLGCLRVLAKSGRFNDFDDLGLSVDLVVWDVSLECVFYAF